MKDTSDRHRFKGAIYVGAAVSAVMALLPYVNKLFLTVYVLGPLAGVWFATRRSTKPLTFTEGAEIGFLSAFYGVIAAPGGVLGVRLFQRADQSLKREK